MEKSDKQREREDRRQAPPPSFSLSEDIANHLDALAFEGARLLHIGDPADGSALCDREGEPEPVGPVAGRLATELCKGCREVAAAIVVVKKPDPKTGELVVELVNPNRYKRPSTDPVVSRRFAQRVLAGESPALTYPRTADCPVGPGDVIRLSSNVSIEILSIGFKKGSTDHHVAYKVIDDRPVLVRRTPPMHEPPALDARGKPKGLSTAEEEATRIASGYTQDPEQAVPATAPEVEVEYRRVISVKKRTKEAEAKGKEAPMAGTDEDVRRAKDEMRELVKRATKMGLDPVEVMAPIFRSIEEAHASLSTEPERKAA